MSSEDRDNYFISAGKALLVHAPSATSTNGQSIEWTNELLNCVKSVNAQVENLVFVDFYASESITKEAQGAVCCIDPPSYIKEVIQGLIDRHMSVGLSPDFAEGTYSSDAEDPSALFGLAPAKEEAVEAIDGKFTVQQFAAPQMLKDGGRNVNDWRKEAAKNSMIAAWAGYIELIGSWRGEQHVFGLPVTLPPAGDRDRPTFVGSLFWGIRAKEDNEAIRLAALVASPLVSFLLRSFAINVAHQVTKAHEIRRAHNMLLHLQNPLSRMMRAFESVSAEAQEMNAILNQPEIGLFGAHKQLARLFHDHAPVSVSPWLSIPGNHGENADPSIDVARARLALALCTVFGVAEELHGAQTSDALIAMASDALRKIRRQGVQRDMVELLTSLMVYAAGRPDGHEGLTLEDFIATNRHTSLNNASFERMHRCLKYTCFTPFKDFSGVWPDIPIYVATYGANLNKNTDIPLPKLRNHEITRLPVGHSPVPQHAILAFIAGIRSYIKAEHLGLDIKRVQVDYSEVSSGKPPVLSHYTFHLPIPLYNPRKGRLSSLENCHYATARYGASSQTVGNFLGPFQDLVRHACAMLSSSDWIDPASLEETNEPANPPEMWRLQPLSQPAERIFTLLHMCSNTPKDDPRCFRVVQENLDDGGCLLKILFVPMTYNLANSLPSAATTTSDELATLLPSTAEDPQNAVDVIPGQLLIVVIDHEDADPPWTDFVNQACSQDAQILDLTESRNNEQLPTALEQVRPLLVVWHAVPNTADRPALLEIILDHFQNSVRVLVVTSQGAAPNLAGVLDDSRFTSGLCDDGDTALHPDPDIFMPIEFRSLIHRAMNGVQ